MKQRKMLVSACTLLLTLNLTVQPTFTKAASTNLEPSHSLSPTVRIDGHSYDQKLVDAVDYLSGIREKMGLNKVKLNPMLVKAAQNHADYLVTNKVRGHREIQGQEGFTGAKLRDRLKSIAPEEDFGYLSEGISYNTSILQESINTFLNTAYHRAALVDPNLVQIGFGVSGDTVVVTFDLSGSTDAVAVYPYNGQIEVETGFYGYENPNPLDQFGISTSGYIISYTRNPLPENIEASIKNSRGEEVPFFIEKSEVYKSYFFFPKKVLSPSENYTVTVEDKSWAFTTANASTNGDFKRYWSEDIGIMINGKYVEMNPKAKVFDGNVFIPLEGIEKAMGANMIWDSNSQSITIKRGSTELGMKIGSKMATINNNPIEISTAPFIFEDATKYLPLRQVSDALGVRIQWVGEEWTAVIQTN